MYETITIPDLKVNDVVVLRDALGAPAEATIMDIRTMGPWTRVVFKLVHGGRSGVINANTQTYTFNRA